MQIQYSSTNNNNTNNNNNSNYGSIVSNNRNNSLIGNLPKNIQITGIKFNKDDTPSREN